MLLVHYFVYIFFFLVITIQKSYEYKRIFVCFYLLFRFRMYFVRNIIKKLNVPYSSNKFDEE